MANWAANSVTAKVLIGFSIGVILLLVSFAVSGNPVPSRAQPSWYLTEYQYHGFLLGYGQGATLALADLEAQKNLSQQLGLSVKVSEQLHYITNTSSSQDSVSYYQSNSTQQSSHKLLGAKRVKQQFSDQWYVAWVMDVRDDTQRLVAMLQQRYEFEHIEFVGNEALLGSKLLTSAARNLQYQELDRDTDNKIRVLVDLVFHHQNWWLQLNEQSLLLRDVQRAINWQAFNSKQLSLSLIGEQQQTFGYQLKNGQEFYLRLVKQRDSEHCLMLNLYSDGRIVLLKQNLQTEQTWTFPERSSQLVLSANLLDNVKTLDTFMAICSRDSIKVKQLQDELLLTNQSYNANYRWHDLMHELDDPLLTVATYTMEVMP